MSLRHQDGDCLGEQRQNVIVDIEVYNFCSLEPARIIEAALPFFACLVVCIVLITVFPQIVTILPDIVMGREK